MRTRKRMALALAILFVLSLVPALAGCGAGAGSAPAAQSAGTGAAASTPQPAGADAATLNFYLWGEEQKEAMDGIAEGFMGHNPNITVECTIIPFADYIVKLKTSLPSGTGPDVFWINKTAMDLQEYLEPIQDRAAADGVDMDNFVGAIVGMFTVDGNLYGIPKDNDTPALFYNKAIFDEAGVDYPTNEWKWADWREAAMQLTSDGVYGVAAQGGIYDGIYNYLPCNGAPIYNEDYTKFTANTPEGVEALQFMLDLMYVDKCSPTAADMVELSASDMFMAGQVATLVCGSWNLGNFYKALGTDLGIAMTPYNKERVYQSNGLAFAMAATGTQKDLAWEFLKYCGSSEAQEIQAIAVIPALKGAEAKWSETYADIDVSAISESLNYTIPMYFASKNMNECADKMTEVFTNVWLQSTTPADGLAELETAINALNE